LTLSTGQIDTLRNLAAKKAGRHVRWVAIAEARELTELGLAARNRSGWEITPDGEVALLGERDTVHADAAFAPLPFPVRGAR
jgi:hypothetical protein